jgi:hypothetical protein
VKVTKARPYLALLLVFLTALVVALLLPLDLLCRIENLLEAVP